MSDVNYTLFKTFVNNLPDNYQLQVITDFSLSNYSNDGFDIIQIPQHDNDLLYIKLKVKPGADNHIVHDFSIGNFPINGINEWYLKLEVYDENGVKVKEKAQTEQAEVQAQPRPTKTNSIFN